jgi:receptor-type tyrosine-protein phosphatase gamma
LIKHNKEIVKAEIRQNISDNIDKNKKKTLHWHFLDDQSRVRLMPAVGQKKTSDYINANYIDGYQQCNAYIGTQV